MAHSIALQKAWVITTGDGKKKWHVPANQTLEVDTKTFVKLPRSHCHFASVVFHGCTAVPAPMPKNYSLSASIGYQNLVEQRNKRQAEELRANVPEIFKDLAAENFFLQGIKKAERKARPQTHETLEIEIEDDEEASWTLELVKPLNARDELAVELDPDVLNKVIKYLRHAGFSSDLQDGNKKRKGMSSETPMGIWKRKDTDGSLYFVAKDHNGKRRNCKTLDDALTIIEDNQADEDDEGHGGELHEEAVTAEQS